MVSIKIVRPTLVWTISITYLMSRNLTVILVQIKVSPSKVFKVQYGCEIHDLHQDDKQNYSMEMKFYSESMNYFQNHCQYCN
ncbi:hypothetical protein QG37_02483 [Candidozyma auris]|nr:hypothetical protein QG37_02483 [[Candida] auris]